MPREFDEFKDSRYADWKRVRLAIEHENTLVNHRITWLLTTQGFIVAVLGALFNEAQKTEGLNFRHAGLLTLVLSILSLLVCRAISVSLREADEQLNNLDKWWYRYWNTDKDWRNLEERSRLVSKSLWRHPNIQLRSEQKPWCDRLPWLRLPRVDFAFVADTLQIIWLVIAAIGICLFFGVLGPKDMKKSRTIDHSLFRSSLSERRLMIAAIINSHHGRESGDSEHGKAKVNKKEGSLDTENAEAVQMLRELARKDKKYFGLLARSLNDLATSEGDEKRWVGALRNSLEALWVTNNIKSPDQFDKLRVLAPLQNNLGMFYLNLGQHHKSAACLRKSIQAYQMLASINPLYDGDLVKAKRNLNKVPLPGIVNSQRPGNAEICE